MDPIVKQKDLRDLLVSLTVLWVIFCPFMLFGRKWLEWLEWLEKFLCKFVPLVGFVALSVGWYVYANS